MKWKDVRTPYIHVAPEWENSFQRWSSHHPAVEKQLCFGIWSEKSLMKDRPSELSMNEVRSEHATKALPKMISGFRQMSWMHVKKDRAWICWFDPWPPMWSLWTRSEAKKMWKPYFSVPTVAAAFLQRSMERTKNRYLRIPICGRSSIKRCFSATWS